MDRKTFIRTCGALSMAGASMGSLLQGCAATARTVNSSLEGDAATVPLSEFQSGGSGGPGTWSFLLVRVEGMNRPVCVYRTGPSAFTALSTTCTHRGCEVRPNEGYLACPCHGSEFSTTGEVLQGPAESALKTYRTSVDRDRLRIHL